MTRWPQAFKERRDQGHHPEGGIRRQQCQRDRQVGRSSDLPAGQGEQVDARLDAKAGRPYDGDRQGGASGHQLCGGLQGAPPVYGRATSKHGHHVALQVPHQADDLRRGQDPEGARAMAVRRMRVWARRIDPPSADITGQPQSPVPWPKVATRLGHAPAADMVEQQIMYWAQHAAAQAPDGPPMNLAMSRQVTLDALRAPGGSVTVPTGCAAIVADDPQLADPRSFDPGRRR